MISDTVSDFVKKASADAVAAFEASKSERVATFKASRVEVSPVDPSIIVGIGAVAENVDADGETLARADVTRMAHDFLLKGGERTFKANHVEAIGADLVESWVGVPIYKTTEGTMRVVKAGEAVPDGAKFAGISNDEDTHWFLAIKPHDTALVELAKKGGLSGLSWAGWCLKTPTEGAK